jgi:gamma-glutamyl hercynylcysteine S-oxide synthase
MSTPLSTLLTKMRRHTLALFGGCEHDTFCKQVHPDFSPIGWHLGHIGYTESLWLLKEEPIIQPEFAKIFAVDALPKAQRSALPLQAQVLAYLEEIREAVLKKASLNPDERLWYFLIQHEAQHQETVQWLLQWLQPQVGELEPSQVLAQKSMAQVPSGPFCQGSATTLALDNEQPTHNVHVPHFWIDAHPVSQGQYVAFMEAKGYQDPQWWTLEGWQWISFQKISQPATWGGCADLPVCGISWYEADAYSRFVGKRLPSESEWEKAATLGLLAGRGQVWEWTQTWFHPYPGFESFPYHGYSAAYFDDAHRVLKGGSWATQMALKRPSFRNWFAPESRVPFTGLRCASDFERKNNG